MCMQESFKLGTPESRCRRNYDSEASTKHTSRDAAESLSVSSRSDTVSCIAFLQAATCCNAVGVSRTCSNSACSPLTSEGPQSKSDSLDLAQSIIKYEGKVRSGPSTSP